MAGCHREGMDTVASAPENGVAERPAGHRAAPQQDSSGPRVSQAEVEDPHRLPHT